MKLYRTTPIQETTQTIDHDSIKLTSSNPAQLISINTVGPSSSHKIEFVSKEATKRRIIVKEKVVEENEPNEEKDALRQRPRKRPKKVRRVRSLLYMELDEHDNKTKEFMMYDLADVSKFFEIFLNVELCINECDDI